MPKGRFTSLDVRCAVRDMRAKLIGKRIGNIYDINGRTYLLKLAQSGVESDKLFIVIESGVRIHSTTFSRDRKEVPSIFTMKVCFLLSCCIVWPGAHFFWKMLLPPLLFSFRNALLQLRKAVRTKRLEDIRQLGYDRVVDMTFGSGDGEFHIIVEFYAAVRWSDPCCLFTVFELT
jgi:predicted ribosome quality control (RQC) complex YloA/Tae2 family protein